MRTTWTLGIAVTLAAAAWAGAQETPDEIRAAAEEAWQAEQYYEAMQYYRRLPGGAPVGTDPELAVRILRCRFRLEQFNALLGEADAALPRMGATWAAVAARRLAAGAAMGSYLGEANEDDDALDDGWSPHTVFFEFGDDEEEGEEADAPQFTAAEKNAKGLAHLEAARVLAETLLAAAPADAKARHETVRTHLALIRMLERQGQDEVPPADRLDEPTPAMPYRQAKWTPTCKIAWLARRTAELDDSGDGRFAAAAMYRYALQLMRMNDKRETPSTKWAAAPRLAELVRRWPKAPAAGAARYAEGMRLFEAGKRRDGLAVWTQLAEDGPGEWAERARKQVTAVTEPVLSFLPARPEQPGKPLKAYLAVANIGELDCAAWKVALPRTAEELKAPADPTGFAWVLTAAPDAIRERLGEPAITWTHAVAGGKSMRHQHGTVPLPITEPGVWVVVARGGGRVSGGLVVHSDLALLVKQGRDKFVVVTTHGGTGAPIGGVRFSLASRKGWDRNATPAVVLEGVTGPDGTVEVPRPQLTTPLDHLRAVAWKGDHVALTEEAQYAAWRGAHEREACFLETDRPIYRPGQTVHVRATWRRWTGQGWKPAAAGDTKLRLMLSDPRWDEERTIEMQWLPQEGTGVATASFQLADDALLGRWHLSVDGEDFDDARGSELDFRVEEYRRPEFEVTVRPETPVIRYGREASAVVEARYYSGEPLAGAEVVYTVTRATQDARWNSWWSPWWYDDEAEDAPSGGGEKVRTGTVRTGPDGTVRITFPTRLEHDVDPARDGEDAADAAEEFEHTDYEYFIAVEVTDAGRRTIEAEGTVWASPKQARVQVDPLAGHVRAGEPLVVRVGARSPDGTPIPATGKLQLERLTGPDVEHPAVEVVQAVALAIDATGSVELPITPAQPGRYRVRAVLPDAWGAESSDFAEVTVTGEGYDFAGATLPLLEVSMDRASYRRGATARALIVSSKPAAHVLLLEVVGDRILRWQWIATQGRLTEVTIPCDAARSPSVQLQAHMVHEGWDIRSSVDVQIPPVDVHLDVQLTTDRPVYGPRDTGTVTVVVRDGAGRPVAGVPCSLGVIDRSLLAIQPELAPRLLGYFHRYRVRHHIGSASSAGWEPPSWGGPRMVTWPRGGGAPPGWWVWPDASERVGGGSGGMLSFGDDEGEGAAGGIAFGEDGGGGAPPPPPDGPGLAEPAAAARGVALPKDVRRNFAETALWNPALVTDAQGRATAKVTFPDSLTSWRVLARAISAGGAAGDAELAVETTRPLITRLHSPRVCTERDEFVCSVSTVNGLDAAAEVEVELQVLGAAAQIAGDAARVLRVEPGREARADFRLRAVSEGTVWLVARTRSGAHGDAVAKPLPVRAHAVPVQRSLVGVVAEPGTAAFDAPLPAERTPGTTRFEVTVTPNLGGVVIGALPYLLEYPYGCAEQTTSRMLPAAILASVLRQNDVDLVAQRAARAALPAEALPDAGRASPLFDRAELAQLVRAGLLRLAKMQNPNGGWGWWGGDREIDPWMTAYVVHALQLLEEHDVAIEADLRDHLADMAFSRLQEQGLRGLDPDDAAFVAFVLARRGAGDADALAKLYDQRAKLGMPARAMLAIALQDAHMEDEAEAMADFLVSRLEVLEDEGTASVKVPEDRWWWWGNDRVEATAWTLRAFLRVRPDDPNIDRLARWLVVNRQGSKWKSTRDTALACIALLDYLGETAVDEPDLTVHVKLGDHAFAPIRFTGDDAWIGGHRFVLSGPALDGAGAMPLVITTQGRGRCYFEATASAVSREEDVPAAGFRLHVERTWYRLEAVTKEGKHGPERVWKRTKVEPGEPVQAGERLEIALEVKASVDLQYVAIVDPKATGFEPIETNSEYDWWDDAHQELRDDRVCWFFEDLPQGSRTLRYQVRAEHPGVLHGLPTQAFAMYAPRARGNSAERRLTVQDK